MTVLLDGGNPTVFAGYPRTATGGMTALQIGRGLAGGYPGLMDDVQLSSTTLAAADVAAMYANPGLAATGFSTWDPAATDSTWLTAADGSLGSGTLTLAGGTLRHAAASGLRNPVTLSGEASSTTIDFGTQLLEYLIVGGGGGAVQTGTLTGLAGNAFDIAVGAGGGTNTPGGTSSAFGFDANGGGQGVVTGTGGTSGSGFAGAAKAGFVDAAGTDGVVIVRYAGAAVATGGTVDSNSVPGYTLHTFTDVGSHSLTFDDFAAAFSGDLSGTGGFTWDSLGTLTLSGNNTYAGGTIVNAGSLGDRQRFAAGSGGALEWYTRLNVYDPALSVQWSTAPTTADFGSGAVSGYSTEFVVVPEPGTLALAGWAAAAVAFGYPASDYGANARESPQLSCFLCKSRHALCRSVAPPPAG